ncbi:MAG: PspC domain-containing protein [Candidatus Kariarchaeaceae archaeon]
MKPAKPSTQETTPPVSTQQPSSFHQPPPQQQQQTQYTSQYVPPPTSKKLYRSRSDRVLGGVCAGLGHNTNNDPNLFRILAIISVFFTGGMSILAYIVAWLVIPEEPYLQSVGPNGYQPRM